MPIYDCRKDGRDPRARYFPCPVRVINPADGERIPNVFFLDTERCQIARFIVDAKGEPLVSPQRKKRMVDDGRGGMKLEIYYDRLETWERRPFIALRLNPDGTTGEVVAKSEDVP
ncbi:hypothetical protein VT84_09390 [Gemmata sp. SH-PL17]|uniref:hypothetical protein n=1 Tax=Gemmata sp. SH-PL17 TaxID=1630693 RepID=UPI00078ECC69|nr:hypothetical protein [Gemmata sp. SH-PL17]AMV24597.1 hypothetical protein VT84_09390 [Gemmata sp. SH-PL17]